MTLHTKNCWIYGSMVGVGSCSARFRSSAVTCLMGLTALLVTFNLDVGLDLRLLTGTVGIRSGWGWDGGGVGNVKCKCLDLHGTHLILFGLGFGLLSCSRSSSSLLPNLASKQRTNTQTSKQASKPISNQASKPASKQANEQTNKQANKPASKPTNNQTGVAHKGCSKRRK